MATKTRTTNIPLVVFNCFVRVTKNYNLYETFKTQFERHRNGSCGDGRIGGYSNIQEMMRQVEHVAQHDSQRMHGSGNKDYDYITFLINVMIRNFLEAGGVMPQKLGFYGQEIFDLACYAIYGDAYLEDMDNLNEGAPRPQNELEAWLVGEYMNRKNMGMSETWDEFLMANQSAIRRAQRSMHLNGEMRMETPTTSPEDGDWPF